MEVGAGGVFWDVGLSALQLGKSQTNWDRPSPEADSSSALIELTV